MDYFSHLILKNLERGVVCDTNILLLYIIGSYDQELISKFRKTDSYSKEDFNIVFSVLSRFKNIFITPHILAELSNLSKQLQENHLSPYFRTFVEMLTGYDEEYIEKDIILQQDRLHIFGVADIGIKELSMDRKCLVFTDDSPLTSYLKHSRVDVLNLNEIRTAFWLPEMLGGGG